MNWWERLFMLSPDEGGGAEGAPTTGDPFKAQRDAEIASLGPLDIGVNVPVPGAKSGAESPAAPAGSPPAPKIPKARLDKEISKRKAAEAESESMRTRLEALESRMSDSSEDARMASILRSLQQNPGALAGMTGAPPTPSGATEEDWDSDPTRAYKKELAALEARMAGTVQSAVQRATQAQNNYFMGVLAPVMEATGSFYRGQLEKRFPGQYVHDEHAPKVQRMMQQHPSASIEQAWALVALNEGITLKSVGAESGASEEISAAVTAEEKAAVSTEAPGGPGRAEAASVNALFAKAIQSGGDESAWLAYTKALDSATGLAGRFVRGEAT